MVVTDANIYTTLWTDFRTAIVAAAPYVTNSSTGTTTSANIGAKYEDRGFQKPQIVIEPIDKSEVIDKFGSSQGKKSININVECFYNTSLGVDQLSEQIEAAIKDYSFSGVELVGIVSSNGLPAEPDASKFFVKGITFSFDRE